MEKIKISSDLSQIEKSKKDFEILDTNNPEIKILIINRSKRPIIVRVSTDIENKTQETDKYFFKDEFSKLIELDGKKFKVISVISNQGYTDGNYYTEEHISMETVDEFKGKGIINEMFKVKNIVDDTLNKSSSRFASVINILIQNGYKVVGKLNEKSGEIVDFTRQEFIEKIVKLKMQNGSFSDRLGVTYVFQKTS